MPTPPGGDGAADLSYVMGVAEQLSNMITEYKVIVDKSTVPVGTADKVQEILDYKLQSKEIFSASDYEKITFLWTHLSDDNIDLSFLKYCVNLE